ncbi:hypothetical protein VB776_02010 [Arcicella sp. DC2W]|uniref:Spo0E like sporulation regulatory protein n=1 Tax=Arcicella gelida TaxID=2984195 RepID=A0ABU5RZR5_9BACT|nr:hypothetical protein [Arcicella sp. DC2W]MEA5401670.1 hypothetical protein [Arcicella sp. DC2W]
MNQQLKIIMLEAEKKIYEQVLNNQQNFLNTSEIDELLDLIIVINKQLVELKKNIRDENP